MAEEKEKETESEERGEKGGSKLLLIVIIVLLLLLLVIGGLVAYFLLSSPKKEQPAAQQEIKTHKVTQLTKMGPIYPLDPFTVNLVSSNADRYLKCKINFELDSPALQKEIDQKIPAIRDMIISILSSKSVEEIQTSKGKEKLKDEIKRKVNAILTTGEIRNVYFTEFVIQ